MWGTRRTIAGSAVALLMMAGCGGEGGQPPDEGVPLEEQQLTTLGTNAELGPITLRNVYVQRPPDGEFQPGQSARLLLTLANESPEQDSLIRVTSSHAKVKLRWDRDCDGTAEPVDGLPITANGTVPGPPGRDVTGHLPYFVEVVEFTQPVLAGTSMPVTFTFERAGDITVPAKVQPREPIDEPARYACVDVRAPG
ncbi:Copper(I)-binding protein [Amycolatopsis arida]|uniref:Copper(I)-binding protein n=2 Tax=Amycolatopsis arida TaxID=587909 RepID=A0A1I5LQA4_9PSEU|nr:copper(I)-binding protein [Amycolatopsis arida]SFO99450.1 Copper(I)-binding protein [Amycolatopsis arida]